MRYLKHYNNLTTSVNATLLFAQMMYWFEKMDRPYFKFLRQCEHPACRVNASDSWTEDLGFTESQVKSSIKLIGTKLKRKQTYDLLECNLLLYWSAGNNMTYYCPNYFLMQSLEEYLVFFEKDFSHFGKWLLEYRKDEKITCELYFRSFRELKYLFSILHKNTQQNNHNNNQKKESLPFQNSSNEKKVGNGKLDIEKEKSSAKKERIEIVYPFEDAEFINLWHQWKEYKLESHNFTYSSKAEQASLKLLFDYDLDFAMQLLIDAIANDWKRFHFPDTPEKYKKNVKNESTKSEAATMFNSLYQKYSN